MCEIGPFLPTTSPTGTTFTTDTQTDADGCDEIIFTCKRTDDKTCNKVTVKSDAGNLAETLNAKEASAVLACQEDGTYDSGTTSNVGALSCVFDECHTCTECEIAPLLPTTSPTGTTFTTDTKTDADGCQEVTFVCKRTDDQTCNKVTVQSAAGMLAEAANAKEASAVLTCQKDGTYDSGTTSNVGALSCVFDECHSCTSCDIDAIAPLEADLPTGTSFTSMILPGECIAATAKCQRDDGQVCATISIEATHSGGTSTLVMNPLASQNSAFLECKDDGKYSFRARQVTGITQLACKFENCITCPTCDIRRYLPAAAPLGTMFDAQEQIGANGCKDAIFICKRTDDKMCAKVTAKGAGGILAEATNANEASAVLQCQEDGTYSSGAITEVGFLSCLFDNCHSCTECDINTIAPPMPYPADTSFSATDMVAADGCKQTEVICSRTDTMECDIKIQAGTNDLVTSLSSTEAKTTLACQADGTYSHPATGVTGITSLTCNYDRCHPPCVTCFNLLPESIPVNLPGMVATVTDVPDANGCPQKQIMCTITGVLGCGFADIYAATSVGDRLINSATTSLSATAILTCYADGSFGARTYTNLRDFRCQFQCSAG